jgi:hypothetical protein
MALAPLDASDQASGTTEKTGTYPRLRSMISGGAGFEITRSLAKWLLVSSAIGVVAGVAAIVFDAAIRFVTGAFLGHVVGYLPPAPAGEGLTTIVPMEDSARCSRRGWVSISPTAVRGANRRVVIAGGQDAVGGAAHSRCAGGLDHPRRRDALPARAHAGRGRRRAHGDDPAGQGGAGTGVPGRVSAGAVVSLWFRQRAAHLSVQPVRQ